MNTNTKKKPNILIFMTDQQQAQVIKPEHPCQTPNLDSLRDSSVQFTRTYPPMAHCCPARASFMTGLYPSQHGIFNNVNNDQAIRRSLYDGVETFGEKLKDSGYQMFYTGKWHVSATETPSDRGWTELEVKHGFGDGGRQRKIFREEPVDSEKFPGEHGILRRPGWGSYRLYGTSELAYEETGDYKTVQSAVSQLNQLKDTEDPWCMYVGAIGPHDPFIVPEKYATMYDPSNIELPASYHDECLDKPGLYRRMRKIFGTLSEEEVRESIAHYWGYCTMMDDLFGELLGTMRQNEQLEDTVIIFMSDHGEFAGAHGLYCKGLPHFDEGYRIPLVISHPELVKQSGTVNDFVSIMDLAPTILEIGEAEPLERCSGQSLLPYLKGSHPETLRNSVYTQCNGVELYYTSRSVTTDQYKFVFNPMDIDELYDIQKDPHEMVNLAELPEMEKVKKQMYQQLWEHAFSSEDTIFCKYMTVTLADYGPGVVHDEI